MVKLQGKSTTNAPITQMATLHDTSCQSATDYDKYNYQPIHHFYFFYLRRHQTMRAIYDAILLELTCTPTRMRRISSHACSKTQSGWQLQAHQLPEAAPSRTHQPAGLVAPGVGSRTHATHGKNGHGHKETLQQAHRR